jgi:hypothetical protein
LNMTGSTVVTINVSDGEDVTTSTFNFTIRSINDMPSIHGVADIETDEDTPTASSFTISDIETADGALTLNIEVDESYATVVTENVEGSVVVTLDPY